MLSRSGGRSLLRPFAALCTDPARGTGLDRHHAGEPQKERTAPILFLELSSRVQTATDASGYSGKPEPTAPFAYADWTWLNGTRRNKVAVWDSKFFTPEVRLDSRRTHQYLIYYQLLTCDS